MNLIAAVLSTLSRDDLKQIVDGLGIGSVDRRSVEGLRAALSRSSQRSECGLAEL